MGRRYSHPIGPQHAAAVPAPLRPLSQAHRQRRRDIRPLPEWPSKGAHWTTRRPSYQGPWSEQPTARMSWRDPCRARVSTILCHASRMSATRASSLSRRAGIGASQDVARDHAYRDYAQPTPLSVCRALCVGRALIGNSERRCSGRGAMPARPVLAAVRRRSTHRVVDASEAALASALESG